MSDPLPHLTGPLAERYRVLQVLGEGGMGVVYEAEQIEPVRRRVALKLLKVGMDSRSFVARFAAERQALAVMDHPNIAKVLDAGSTEEGRPYYVMELVPGLPLTQFCDEQRLGTRGRLELFMDVCHAVQHAHQKGVIHRDLKPTNVLVMVRDDRPIPKVIDFGIAKAIGGSLTERTLVTEHGRPMGTAAYMSPEQWDAAQLDIDTRSDIYSLGVMLYELLVGRLPVDPHALVRAGVGAAALLRDTAPVPPSAWFQSGDQVAITAAKERDTAPQVLVRELRGDLDWITLKAMDHDRRGRYATAHELALDIGRHLRGGPALRVIPAGTIRTAAPDRGGGCCGNHGSGDRVRRHDAGSGQPGGQGAGSGGSGGGHRDRAQPVSHRGSALPRSDRRHRQGCHHGGGAGFGGRPAPSSPG